jgi:hypothetical protein
MFKIRVDRAPSRTPCGEPSTPLCGMSEFTLVAFIGSSFRSTWEERRKVILVCPTQLEFCPSDGRNHLKIFLLVLI